MFLGGLNGCRLGNCRSFLRLRFLSKGIGIFSLAFLIDIAEDVVQNKVAGGLLSKNEGLNELLGLLTSAVRDLANNLDNNVLERCLRVYVGDANLAVLVFELLDTLLDSLVIPLA